MSAFDEWWPKSQRGTPIEANMRAAFEAGMAKAADLVEAQGRQWGIMREIKMVWFADCSRVLGAFIRSEANRVRESDGVL